MAHIQGQDDKAVETLNFEDALAALEGIVAKLESGQVPLEQLIALYERGQRLKAHCESRLASAQAKIEQIQTAPDGTIGTHAFGSEAE